MPHYQVKYSLGKNNEFVYPESVAGVVWKSTLYHYTDHVMIGETDDDVHANGKEVISLSSDEVRKLEKEYRSTRPKPKKSPEEIF